VKERGGLGVIKKFAFLLLTFLILSGNGFAIAPIVSSGGTYTSYRNTNIDLNGSATDIYGDITSIYWEYPTADCIITEFEDISDPHNAKNNAIISCTSIGVKDLNLIADNNYGEQTIESTSLTISNQDPIANLEEDVVTGNPTLTVTFTGFCSDLDGNGTINTCFLDYGDGEGKAISGPPYYFTETHNYDTEGTYYAKLMANDDQDINGSDIDGITVTQPSAPTINNKNPTSNINNVLPTISFDVNDSGSGANIASLALFVDNETVAPTTTAFGSSYHVSWIFGSAISNDHIVYVGLSVEDSLGNSTGDVNWNFTIDTEAPTFDDIDVADYTNDSTPTISLEDVSGSPTEMALSCDNSNWKGWQAYSASVTDFSITSSSYGCLDGSEGNVEIYLKLRDEAENESDPENDSSTYDNSNPDSPTLNVATAGNEDVYLDWPTVSDNGPSGIKEYVIYRNNSQIGTTTDTEYNAEGLSNGTEYDFKIRARDNANNISGYSNEKSATPTSGGTSSDTVDTSPPYLNWELPNRDSTISGIVTLKVWVYDDESTLHPVRFYVDNETINIGSDGSPSGERYSIEWNSETVVDGTHTLKALAKNRSGDEDHDTTIKTITITTNNGITEIDGTITDSIDENNDEDKIAAENALDVASAVKETVDSLLAELDVLGIALDAEQDELFGEAQELLGSAQELFDGEDYEEAIEKADEAAAMLEELAGLVAVETYGEKSLYVFNEEHLELLMKGLGFSQSVCDEATEMLESNGVERSLSLKQVGNGNGVYYKAVITLVVKNDSGEAQEVKIIEVIPKEFAETASEIAGKNFTVIVDDPVLEWTVSLEAGEEETIVYALKSELTAEQANAMIDSEILNKFAVPPVLVSSETEMNEASFSGTAIGLFGLGGAVELGGWIVLIIAVIAIVALFATGKIGKEKETPFGIQTAAGRAGFGSGFFDKIGGSGKKEESSDPKWKYSG